MLSLARMFPLNALMLKQHRRIVVSMTGVTRNSTGT